MTEAILLAGGGGERFWPRSRATRPKQFLPLLSDRPMIAETAARVAPLVERTWVVTRAGWEDRVRECVPGAEVLGEPAPRSTAAALGLVAVRVPPETTLVALPADHDVPDADGFREVLGRAIRAAERNDGIVCLGFHPSRPETGYGYIRRGEEAGGGVFRVASFVEKPPAERAERLIEEGAMWNGGIFAFRAGVLLDEIRRHLPDLAEGLMRIARALGTEGEGRTVEAAYRAMPTVSIDRGVLEKTKRAFVVEAPVAWDDVGDWNALARRAREVDGNFVGRGDFVGLASRGVVADADEGMIAAVGVKDLVIVRDGDVVLVAARSATGSIGDLLRRLREDAGKRRYL